MPPQNAVLIKVILSRLQGWTSRCRLMKYTLMAIWVIDLQSENSGGGDASYIALCSGRIWTYYFRIASPNNSHRFRLVSTEAVGCVCRPAPV